MSETPLPEDLRDALYAFVQNSEEIRSELDIAREPSVYDAQPLITVVANLTATARAYLPPVLSPTGEAPVVHFVSTLFVPDSMAIATKNDLILWAGPIGSMATAALVAGWPSGTTVHLSVRSFAIIVEAGKGVNVQAGKHRA